MQSELFIQRYFGLTQEQLDELSDDVFLDLAAKAHFLFRQDAEAIKAGTLMALSVAFGEGKGGR